MASSEYFRAGVGVVVIDGHGFVLALERTDVEGSWQLPQGGIEVGEEPIDAAERELAEETGIRWRSVELLDVHPVWLAYELPPEHRSAKTGRGQVHRWYLVRFAGQDHEIALDSGVGGTEFASWRWMPILELVASTWEIRRPVYRELASHWSSVLA
jgi:putative (di)nucleoside polyphosphate hydrolase